MTLLSFCSLAPEAAAFPVTDLEVSGIQKEKKKRVENLLQCIACVLICSAFVFVGKTKNKFVCVIFMALLSIYLHLNEPDFSY